MTIKSSFVLHQLSVVFSYPCFRLARHENVQTLYISCIILAGVQESSEIHHIHTNSACASLALIVIFTIICILYLPIR